MQESLINKEARERFAASPMNRAFPEIIETMDCEPENLRALCAPCHLRYDRQHHAETRRRNGKRNNAERNRQ